MYQKTGQSIKRVAEIFAYIGVIVSCIASVGAYRRFSRRHPSCLAFQFGACRFR